MGAMGSLFSGRRKPVKIVMVGLDSAGKSTILQKMAVGLDTEVFTTSTIGFATQEIRHKKLTLNLFDLGGQQRLREMWPHYMKNVRGIIFVIGPLHVSRI